MRIIGIDPGKEGGIARIYDRKLLAAKAMEEFDWSEFRMWSTNADHIFMEKASARPGQGVVSMFTFGTGFGRLQGWIEASGVPYTLVPPQVWARVMHAGTSGDDTKKRSIEAAKRLFPGHDFRLGKSTKQHLGILEAALIAAFGERQLLGGTQ